MLLRSLWRHQYYLGRTRDSLWEEAKWMRGELTKYSYFRLRDAIIFVRIWGCI